MPYKAIDQLLALQKQYRMRVATDSGLPHFSALVPVHLYIGNSSWLVYVDDEYKDLDEARQPMCLFLTLSALETYKEAADFLVWCTWQGLSPASDPLRRYYMDMAHVLPAIEARIGPVDPFISSFDYGLRTGVVQELALL